MHYHGFELLRGGCQRGPERRRFGAEAFGDHADNLTSIIATVSIPK